MQLQQNLKNLYDSENLKLTFRQHMEMIDYPMKQSSLLKEYLEQEKDSQNKLNMTQTSFEERVREQKLQLSQTQLKIEGG
jgi:hypothetical protein